jgi:hypothetical protein
MPPVQDHAGYAPAGAPQADRAPVPDLTPNLAPHSALGMRSPADYRALASTSSELTAYLSSQARAASRSQARCEGA